MSTSTTPSALIDVQTALYAVKKAQIDLSAAGSHPIVQTDLTSAIAPLETAITTLTPSPLGILGNWNLIFSDEFVGTTLDKTKWSAGWWPNAAGLSDPVNSAETAGYNSSNVSVSGGYLNLELTQKAMTAPSGTKFSYTGALVSTNPSDGRASGGFEYTYGVYEARVNLPAASNKEIANWPAVWTNAPSTSVWQEDDVFEGLGGYASYHFHNSTNNGPGSSIFTTPGWHTFASEWTPTSITYYYDGINVGQIEVTASEPNYLILDNTTNAPVGKATVPATFQVDYVRVWQTA